MNSEAEFIVCFSPFFNILYAVIGKQFPFMRLKVAIDTSKKLLTSLMRKMQLRFESLVSILVSIFPDNSSKHRDCSFNIEIGFNLELSISSRLGQSDSMYLFTPRHGIS